MYSGFGLDVISIAFDRTTTQFCFTPMGNEKKYFANISFANASVKPLRHHYYNRGFHFNDVVFALNPVNEKGPEQFCPDLVFVFVQFIFLRLSLVAFFVQ